MTKLVGSPMRRVHDESRAKKPGRPARRKPHTHLRTNRVGAIASPARFHYRAPWGITAVRRVRAPISDISFPAPLTTQGADTSF